MMDFINWCKDNYEGILAAVGAFYAFATVVATLTPTGKDDTILEKIGAIADRFGIQLKGK
jgi:hypothetical protein